MPQLLLSFGDGRVLVDLAARQAHVDNQPAKLGGRAFDLLVALIERRERVVSKQELLDVVWPRLFVEENNLQVHVMALRKLLGANAIVTVSGRGYRWTLQPDTLPAAVPPLPAFALDDGLLGRVTTSSPRCLRLSTPARPS